MLVHYVQSSTINSLEADCKKSGSGTPASLLLPSAAVLAVARARANESASFVAVEGMLTGGGNNVDAGAFQAELPTACERVRACVCVCAMVVLDRSKKKNLKVGKINSKSNRNRNRNRNRNQRCQWYVHIAMLRKLLCLLAHFESAASCTLALLVE